MGHIGVDIGIPFGHIGAELSDGAKMAVERALRRIFQLDWREVLDPENVLEQVRAITRGRQA